MRDAAFCRRLLTQPRRFSELESHRGEYKLENTHARYIDRCPPINLNNTAHTHVTGVIHVALGHLATTNDDDDEPASEPPAKGPLHEPSCVSGLNAT